MILLRQSLLGYKFTVFNSMIYEAFANFVRAGLFYKLANAQLVCGAGEH
jgi:hypothetical protein